MTFDDKAIDWLIDLLARTADAEIMTRFRRLGSEDVRQKTSATDLVTEADVNAERVITAALKQRYPDALVVGEEAHAEDPSVLPQLGDAELAFVIDPVDGTINFASGLPLFGVMLAVVVKGETVAGIIYDPVGRDCLIGLRGAGSHLRRSDGTLERCRWPRRPPSPTWSARCRGATWKSPSDRRWHATTRNSGRHSTTGSRRTNIACWRPATPISSSTTS